MDIGELKEQLGESNEIVCKGMECIRGSEEPREKIVHALGALLSALDGVSVSGMLQQTNTMSGYYQQANVHFTGSRIVLGLAHQESGGSPYLEGAYNMTEECVDQSDPAIVVELAHILRQGVAPALEQLVEQVQEALEQLEDIAVNSNETLADADTVRDDTDTYISSI